MDVFRCFGNKPGQELYAAYHDHEWGVPLHDDQKLFEMLVLEGAQAGLSWEVILKKRPAYRRAFHDFDPHKVAAMSNSDLDFLCNDAGLVRKRRKIYAARQNAVVCITLQQDFGSLDAQLWAVVAGKPKINNWKTAAELPAHSLESSALAKDLKSRGMSFVGPTVLYAFMQAVGMVNDHLTQCPRHSQLSSAGQWKFPWPSTTRLTQPYTALAELAKNDAP